MALHPYQIAEQLERERRDRAWTPEPLYAPSPTPPPARRRDERTERDSESQGGSVVIIDISSGEITTH